MPHCSNMDIEDLPAVLIPLGFTETEALAYGELLKQPDQTGYSLSKAIQKGQPVTYAALAGLEARGAVMASFAPAKVYRAIAPTELISALRRQFDRRCAVAEESLAYQGRVPSNDQLFHLKTATQVRERARAMINAAQATVLFELFPGPAQQLRPDLEAAAAKPGVSVAGVVLRVEDHIAGARTILPARSEYIAAAWKEDVLILIVDARQILIASINGLGVLSRAIWTDNLFVSVLFHNAISADVLLHEKMGADWKGPNMDLFGKVSPGFFELVDPE